MKTALEMRQDRHAIAQEMNAIISAATPDLARWKELDKKQEALRVQIEATERTEQVNRELSAVRNAERPNVGEIASAKTPEARALAIRSTEQYKADFEAFIRGGVISSAMAETRALGAASSPLVPQGFEQELSIKLKAYGGMRRLARVITTSTGNPLPWPRLDDVSSTGEWLTEASGVGTQDPSFDSVTLNANLLSSKQVKLSVQLLQDSAFDLASVLSDAFAIRMGRTENAAFTVGDGSGTYGTVTGLVNALVTDGTRSVLAIGANSNSGNAGDTTLNSVGTDDLANLISKVDPAYRPGAKFAANQATWDKLRTLKDKYGRPIWQTSLAVGVPDSIDGYGYDYNQDMDAVGAGKKSVIFGNFNNYIIRDVLGFTLLRLDELYAANYQVAFQAFKRVDAKLLQATAFAYLIHPLS